MSNIIRKRPLPTYDEIVAIAENVRKRQPFSYVQSAIHLANFILDNDERMREETRTRSTLITLVPETEEKSTSAPGREER